MAAKCPASFYALAPLPAAKAARRALPHQVVHSSTAAWQSISAPGMFFIHATGKVISRLSSSMRWKRKPLLSSAYFRFDPLFQNLPQQPIHTLRRLYGGDHQ